ncbi:hypothetical protein GCM10009677_42400 [Sphaerisporangium rubeum]|uniref:Uncharacterized protein n=1 Tax=Sphaerisporangium rubeum TaxID=321317 RepID=A0A7X0M4F4_9ACTN|nr:hypothetical protein [Sphaerisporangium rubeum]MBB6471603.1 hypothetical protein [Sphaerisporangium rubeum]
MDAMTTRALGDEGGEPQEPGERAKLSRLRDSLERLGMRADLHEEMPALTVRCPGAGPPVWVFVGYGGGYFSWQSAEKRHPVGDVPGAAVALAEYVTGRVF